MSVKTIASLIIVLFFVGIGVFIGWHIKPEPTLVQPEPTPEESFEVPAVIEVEAEVESKRLPVGSSGSGSDSRQVEATDRENDPVRSERTNIIAKQKPKPTTLLVTPPLTPPHLAEQIVTAFHPFYFSREGASFQMDITYRYSDQKFRFSNMQFVAPKRQVVYRESLLKFGSAMGLLTDTKGNTKLLLQPINFSLWKINFYPTLMIDPEYQISYGGLVGFRW